MYPILFSVGDFHFYTHGLLMVLGAVIGGLVMFYLAKKENLSSKILLDCLIYSLFAGIVGARLAYLFFYHNQFSSFKEMLMIWYGGMVSFGGILAGFFAAWVFLLRSNQNVSKWFDIGTIGLLIGWTFGRLGCFLTGDTPGISSVSSIAIDGQIPIALMESIWSFLLGIFLLYLYLKKKDSLFGGFIFYLGMIGYLIGRFIIDFWRDDKVVFFHLIDGQLVALGLILIMSIVFTKQIMKAQRGEYV